MCHNISHPNLPLVGFRIEDLLKLEEQPYFVAYTSSCFDSAISVSLPEWVRWVRCSVVRCPLGTNNADLCHR